MADEPIIMSNLENEYQFQLDVDIRKRRNKPLFKAFGKTIYDVEWINRDGSPIILLKIDGAKANREASYYVNLSDHSHIVRTFGLVRSHPGSVMLLQECASQGDLSELLQENGFKPSIKVLYNIFTQICDAMTFLSYNGIVHGDLACRNVLVFQSNPIEPTKNLVKLTDFGLTRASSLYSIVDGPAQSSMIIIPVRYAAPEILRNPDRSNYSEKSDIYSMGVLMWEACSYGELPYSSIHEDNDIRREKLAGKILPRPSICSDQLWMIMKECWPQDPDDRPSFQKLKRLLELNSTRRTYSGSSRQSNESIHPSPAFEDSQSVSSDNIRKNSSTENKKQCSSELIQCEYCHNRCAQIDYEIHKQHCLHNRKHSSSSTQRLSTSFVPHDNQIKQRTSSKSIIRIPCEYCGESIEAANTLAHAQICSEQQNKKVKTVTRNTDIKRMKELLPCEYCDKPYSKEQLLTHQVNCSQNPENVFPEMNFNRKSLAENIFDTINDDNRAPLLLDDKNKRLRSPSSSSSSLNSDTPLLKQRNRRKSRLPCCCCC